MRAAWYGRTINITATLINQSVNYLAGLYPLVLREC